MLVLPPHCIFAKHMLSFVFIWAVAASRHCIQHVGPTIQGAVCTCEILSGLKCLNSTDKQRKCHYVHCTNGEQGHRGPMDWIIKGI